MSTMCTGEHRFQVALFRDTCDVIPRGGALTYQELVQLVAPERAPIGHAANQALTKELKTIRESKRHLSEGTDLQRRWPGGTRTYSQLERAQWTAKGSNPRAALEAEARKLCSDAAKHAKGKLPSWSPTTYRDGATRGSAGVTQISCLVLDYDDGTSPAAATAPWTDWPHVVASTWSHRPGSPRFRVVVPLAEPIPVHAWSRSWRWAQGRASGAVDEACKDPSRIYLLPAVCNHEQEYLRLVHEPGGRLLRIDWEDLPADRTTSPPPPSGLLSDQGLHRPQRRVRSRPNHSRRIAQQRLNHDQSTRLRAAERLGGRVINGRAEELNCPSCSRPSVWFYLEPGHKKTASCNHKNSCGWYGYLDQLLDAHGGLHGH